MSMTYTLAFSVFKGGIKDCDGLLKIAEVHLGIVGGPAAGLAVEGILIKEHTTRGMQIVYPPCVIGFLTTREETERTILRAFASAYSQATQPKPETRLDDFTGIPDPQVGKFVH